MTEEGGPKTGRERERAEMNRAWRASRTKRRESRSAFHIKLSIQVSASFYDSMWSKWSSENIEIKATQILFSAPSDIDIQEFDQIENRISHFVTINIHVGRGS